MTCRVGESSRLYRDVHGRKAAEIGTFDRPDLRFQRLANAGVAGGLAPWAYHMVAASLGRSGSSAANG